LLELLTAEPWLLWLGAFVLGALIGSFLNVVIYRMPVMMQHAWEDELAYARDAAQPAAESDHSSTPTPAERARFNLIVPRSRCGHCGHQITAIENIPILSWLALRGKCSACGTRIGMRYPLVELGTALLFLGCAATFGASLHTLAAMAFCAVLVALTGIDFDTQLLPDQLTLPLLWLGLLLNVGGLFAPLPDAVIGAAAGYLILWLVYWAFKLATGREGMGYGDFKLLGALGAWFGWQSLAMILLLSSVVGAVVGIGILVVQKKGRQTAIAFGPYLAMAGLITLFFGAQLRSAFLGL
jgi:leader peptidase (prepilin peptidase) / N-methyltransferase